METRRKRALFKGTPPPEPKRPRTGESDAALNVSKAELEQNINTFVTQRKRENDRSNIAEFRSSDPEVRAKSCARSDAQILNRETQMKTYRVENVIGPSDAALLRSRELTRSQSNNPPSEVSAADATTEHPNNAEDEEVNVLDVDTEYDHKFPSLVERLRNLETTVFPLDVPRDIYDRIKQLEERVLELEKSGRILYVSVGDVRANEHFAPVQARRRVGRPPNPVQTPSRNAKKSKAKTPRSKGKAKKAVKSTPRRRGSSTKAHSRRASESERSANVRKSARIAIKLEEEDLSDSDSEEAGTNVEARTLRPRRKSVIEMDFSSSGDEEGEYESESEDFMELEDAAAAMGLRRRNGGEMEILSDNSDEESSDEGGKHFVDLEIEPQTLEELDDELDRLKGEIDVQIDWRESVRQELARRALNDLGAAHALREDEEVSLGEQHRVVGPTEIPVMLPVELKEPADALEEFARS